MPLATDLPERLRKETRELHQQAERSGLMADLLAGRIARPRYCEMLRNLHALYAALEVALAQPARVAAWGALDLVTLRRAPALADDLEQLHGPAWAADWPLKEATRVYVERLGQLARSESPALLAHAYVRYLGDLHGGQLLRRRVAGSLGLSGDAGTRFFDFGPDEQVLALRLAFRRMLAALPLAADEVALVVAEARWGFGQHRRLFEQLGSG